MRDSSCIKLGCVALLVCLAGAAFAQRSFPLGINVNSNYVEGVGYLDAVSASTTLYNPVLRTMAPSVAQLQGESPTTGATITNPTNLIYLVASGLRTDIIGPRAGGTLSITGATVQAASVSTPSLTVNGVAIAQEFQTASTNLYEDLRFPPQAVNISGGTAFCALIGTWGPNANQLAMAFDRSKTECLYVIAQLPHNYVTNTVLYPHLHISPNTSNTGDVVFVMRYTWANIGATFPTEVALTNVVTIASDSKWIHLMPKLGSMVPGAGQGGFSSMLHMRLERLGADSRDTFNADIHLLEFDLHYLTRGSPLHFDP